MDKPKNRIVIQNTGENRRRVFEYITQRDAISSFYSRCDQLDYPYGSPIYDVIDGKRVQVGMETGGIGYDYKITLYI